MKIILASQSPRRKELLQNMGLEFEVIVSNTKEDMTQKVNFEKLSEILSKQKAQDIFEKTQGEGLILLKLAE